MRALIIGNWRNSTTRVTRCVPERPDPGMGVDDDLFDAKVTVLGEQIDHHVQEEEGDMFPKAKKAKLDTQGLGAEMGARRGELMSELGAGEADEAPPRPSVPRKRPEVRR